MPAVTSRHSAAAARGGARFSSARASARCSASYRSSAVIFGQRSSSSREIAVAGAKVGGAAGQVGRQVLGQQRRCRIDAVPGEHARAAEEASAHDRAHRIQRRPALGQVGVVLALQRGGPVHAAVVLGQAAAETGQLLEVAFTGARAFVVGLAGDDTAALGDQRQRAGEQRTGFFTLARRQHQHQRVTALAGHIVQLAADGPAGGLLRLRERGKALFAVQLAVAGRFAQRPSRARRKATGPSGQRRAPWENGRSRVCRGVVAGGHRRGYFKREGRPLYRLGRAGRPLCETRTGP